MPYRLLRGHARERRSGAARKGGNARTCQSYCIRRIAARQVTDPATFSALLIAMPVDERVQVAAHAPREHVGVVNADER